MTEAKFTKRLTRAEQVKKAKAILSKSKLPWGQDLIEDLVLGAIDFVEEHERSSLRDDAARSSKTKKELRTLTKRLRNARNSAKKLPEDFRSQFTSGIDELLEAAERTLRLPAGPKHRTSYRKQAAVGKADSLLDLYHLPFVIRRGGDLHRLAAILYGDEKADLYRHMRPPDN